MDAHPATKEGPRRNEGFFERVYEVVEQIPRGCVATYGQVAALMGAPRCARQVGYALHANPDRASSHAIASCLPMGTSARGSPLAEPRLNESSWRQKALRSKTTRMSI